MSQLSSECTHASGTDVLDRPGRLPYELVLVITGYSLNTKCTTDHSRDFNPRLAVLLARAGPFYHLLAGYTEQKGAGNGPEGSCDGGCDPGTRSFGGVDSPELIHSPLGLSGSKRKRGRDPAQPTRSTSTKQTGRTFACPYYLHDRIRHRDCLNIRLTRLSDVRQHLLERAHYQAVHCPTCGIVFQGRLGDARRLRDAHIQAEICERSPLPFYYPGITEDGEQRIREIARNNRTNQVTEVHRWFMIWDFLFPGEERPDSPFLNDVPEIQRLVDWSSTIFDNDLWMALPIEPWTTAMDREQRRAGMFHFIDRFIVLARDLMLQDTSPVEDQHQADTSSYMGVNTPAPSVVTADSGVAPPGSSGSNVAAEASIYLSPTHVTGLQQARGTRTLDRMEPRTSNLSPPGPSIPFRPANGPAVRVPQEMQQPAPPGEAGAVQQDPAIPSLAIEGFSINIFATDDDWVNSFFNSELVTAHHNLDPAGEDEIGRNQ